MRSKKKYLFIIILILLALFFISIFINKSYSKYVISEEKVGFYIEKLMDDNIKPAILINHPEEKESSNISLTDDRYFTNKDVSINYDDNIKIDTAKYWYNQSEENFYGEGNDFENGRVFTEEGWYKIVITDIFSNTNTIVFLIDKTPPVITVVSNENGEETFSNSSTDIVIETNDITISTSDNFVIDYNEYWYNSTSNSFTESGTRFTNGTSLAEEGYYRLTAYDKVGNQTTIVVLLDKTAPNITVTYYKKNQISLIITEEIVLSLKNGGIC